MPTPAQASGLPWRCQSHQPQQPGELINSLTQMSFSLSLLSFYGLLSLETLREGEATAVAALHGGWSCFWFPVVGSAWPQISLPSFSRRGGRVLTAVLGPRLAFQWLGLRTSTAGGMGSIALRELRSCVPHSVAKKKKTPPPTKAVLGLRLWEVLVLGGEATPCSASEAQALFAEAAQAVTGSGHVLWGHEHEAVRSPLGHL